MNKLPAYFDLPQGIYGLEHVAIWVPGLPESKGSYIGLGGGRVKADNPRERAWRDGVTLMAKAAWRARPRISTYLTVELFFVLPEPIGKKNRRDVDKLSRSVLDALTGVVFDDDELVERLHASKRVGKDIGAMIRVYTPEEP